MIATVLLVLIGMWLFGAGIAPRLAIAVPILAVTSIGVLGIGYLIGAIVLAHARRESLRRCRGLDLRGAVRRRLPDRRVPEALRWMSYLLPTTHALDLMRVAALGTRPLLPLPLEWLMLAVTSVGLLAIGRWAWLATEHRLRVLGTLGQH